MGFLKYQNKLKININYRPMNLKKLFA